MKIKWQTLAVLYFLLFLILGTSLVWATQLSDSILRHDVVATLLDLLKVVTGSIIGLLSALTINSRS